MGDWLIGLELITKILDYLPVSDLMVFARVSRRLKEIVYEDARWIKKLEDMGIWNEEEARRRYDEMIAVREKKQRQAAGVTGPPGSGSLPPDHMTIFDASKQMEQQERERRWLESEKTRNDTAPALGISTSNLVSTTSPIIAQPSLPLQSTRSILAVFSNVLSARGYARFEYGKIHGMLAPYYFNLAKARTHTDPILFRQFREPEEQAIMLAQLRMFAKADTSQGWRDRLDRLESITSIFESAALREFEGYVHLCLAKEMREISQD